MLWIETLLHARLKKLQDYVEQSEYIKSRLDILWNALSETQEALHKAHIDLQDDNGIKQIISKVYEKPGTDMGDFWLSFLEMTDPLVQNMDACHARNGP